MLTEAYIYFTKSKDSWLNERKNCVTTKISLIELNRTDRKTSHQISSNSETRISEILRILI